MRGLYAVTPNWDDTDLLIQATADIIAGGATLVQYRHKTANAAQRLEQASALLSLCRSKKVPFVINDFIELVEQLDADGVHVGGTDEAVIAVRARLGADKIIGASCYGSLELAHQSATDGASYVAFGGFYPSLVKKYEVSTPSTIVAQAKLEIAVPIVVIGGMTVENSRVLVKNGADMVAAITSIYAQPDAKQAARNFSDLFV